MKHYKAPWGTALIVLSTLVTVVCLGVSLTAWHAASIKHEAPGWVALLPLALLFGMVLFTIRGYTVTADGILVHRLFWDNWLPRAGLESATVEPRVMRWSIRTFGNGGGFSISGFYYNRRLGSYRAFVTDGWRTVVLRYANRRIVLSPDAPEDFVRELTATG